MRHETLRVLLIEDDPAQARLFEVTLSAIRDLLFEVEIADRISEGLARLEAKRFDVIILDLMLPDSRGLDTFLTVNAHSPQTPIVLLTATNDETIALETVEQGAQDYLVKGEVDHNLLKRAIQYAIKRKRIEEELRESSHFSKEVISSAGEAIIVYDRELRHVVWNRFTEELTGMPAEEVLGKHALDVFPQLRKQGVYPLLERALAGETVSSTDMPYCVPQTGKSGWVTGTFGPQRDAKGNIIGVIGMVKDITERKQAEQSVRWAEQRYRKLFEEAPVMYVISRNQEGAPVIADCNEMFLNTMGYARSEVLERPITDFYTPESTVELMAKGGYQRALEQGVRDEERELVTREGRIVRTLVRAVPEAPSDGIVTGTRAMYVDITERKRAEEARRQAEEKYRTIFENAIEGIFQGTPEGRFITANPALARMLGYDSPEELIATITDVGQQNFVDPKRRADFVRSLEGRGEVRGFELEAYRKDGSRVWLSINARAVRDEGGKVLHYEGALEDITERRQTEEQLKASLREREVLLKEIHHRVKNNLQVISSLLELQTQHGKDSQAEEALRESQNRVRVMALVHEGLYRSQDLARVDFAEYVQRLVANLFRSYGSIAERIALNARVGEVWLSVDRAIPCGLIINELVSNCLKYAFSESKEGEIRVDLNSDQQRVTLLVGDNGTGFPGTLDYRNSESLGLQLVVALVQQLDGTIELNNQNGAEFTITFSVE